MITYPQSTGRNFNEILRVIDSLQLTAKHKVSTPVNWKQGEDVIIIPAVSDEEADSEVPRRMEDGQAVPADRAAAARDCVSSSPLTCSGGCGRPATQRSCPPPARSRRRPP